MATSLGLDGMCIGGRSRMKRLVVKHHTSHTPPVARPANRQNWRLTFLQGYVGIVLAGHHLLWLIFELCDRFFNEVGRDREGTDAIVAGDSNPDSLTL